MTHKTYSSTDRGSAMQFHWKPMNSGGLAHYVNQNTIIGTETVSVQKMVSETKRLIWEFDVPREHQELVSLLFDLSLSNVIVGYSIGNTTWQNPDKSWHMVDHIILKKSRNGATNITDKVIEAIAERYKPL